ncbi:MAG: porin [Paracoccaceae bacterium]|nr:porin [Paracoccaceae bacterium]
MKKVLLATTALVLSAGFAAADVKISGSANMGLKYDEGNLSYAAKKTAGWYEIDMDVIGTMETDTGLTFGARIQLDSNYADGDQSYGAQTFVSGAFGTFTIGAVDPIADDYGLTDIGFDGIGTDNVAEDAAYTGTADARWDYTVGAVTMGVSLNTVSEDYGLGVAYDAGMFNAALTYDHEDLTDNDTTSLLLGGKFDAFYGEVYVTNNDLRDTSWGIYGSYKTGALLIEASYADADALADEAYGIGAKYDLGGGAKLAGGVGSVNGDTVADFGVTFSF